MELPLPYEDENSSAKQVSSEKEQRFAAVLRRESLFDEFESAWKSGVRPSIETFLVRLPEADRDEVLLELLGIELDERLRRGEFPQFAEYRSRFPHNVAAVKTAYCQAINAPNVTRFQPIDRLGVGGQGEVWRVLDPDLDREVALKVVRPGADGSDPTPATLAKFRREAEVTGKLEHPCIVPVYEAGAETPEGSPFYVMRILREKSLQTAIDEFHRRHSSPEDYARGLRDLLDRFIDVCDAVAYAHSRNVVHRDLKPANVMLGDFGETMVVDWGLAEVLGAETDAVETNVRVGVSPGTTAACSAVGTPAYMPPEQARGDHQQFSPTADIYTLGGILYAILTGRTPHVVPANLRKPRFGEHSILPFIEHIASGQLLITPPHEISSCVPKALAAICLKALSTNPADRYQLAASPDVNAPTLANDVKRVMNDEAVDVYKDPWLKRLQRWTRKNPKTVASAAATVLVATITLTILSVVVNHKNAELDKRNLALDASVKSENAARILAQQNERRAIAGEKDATVAKLRAETNATVAREQSALALSTLNAVIFDIQRSLENVPGGASVRNRLLTSVLPQLDKVSTQFASKSAVDRNTMAAMIHLADTILQLTQRSPHDRPGEPSVSDLGPPNDDPTVRSSVLAAEKLYRRAHDIAQQLARAAPNNSQSLRDLLISYDKLGEVFLILGRTDDARQQLQERFKIASRQAEADPADGEKQRDLSISLERLGDVFLKIGHTDDGVRRHEEAAKISRELAEADRNDAQRQRDLSVSCNKLGDAYLKLSRTNDALVQFHDGLKIRRLLAEAEPSNAQAQRDLSISFEKLGDVYLQLGRTNDAITQFQDGLKIRRVLAVDPNDAQTQRDLAISFNKLGDVLLKLGRSDDALAQFHDGLKISRVLADADPNDARKRRDLAISFERLGDAFLTLGRMNDALAQFQDGLKVRRVLAESDPSDAQIRRDLAISINKLGDVFVILGHADDALKQFQASSHVFRELAEADPSDAQKRRDLSTSFERLGDAYLTLGRNGDALAEFQAKLKIDRMLVEADPKHSDNQRNLSISFERLGEVYLKLGRTDDALSHFEELQDRCRELAEGDPDDAQKQRDLSISFGRLGDIFLKLGRTDDALTQFQNRMKISRELAAADRSSAEKQQDLMVSHYKLGEVEVQAGRFDAAREQFQAGVAVLDRMIAKKQNALAPRQLKDILEGRIQFCAAAELATGDWDALLKTDARTLLNLLPLRVAELAKRGQRANVAQAGAKLRELSATVEPGASINQKGGVLYGAACAYGLCATLSLKDKPPPTDSGNVEHQKHLDLSLSCLKEAVAAGFDNFEHMARDTDLIPLRELPEFQALLEQLPEKKP